MKNYHKYPFSKVGLDLAYFPFWVTMALIVLLLDTISSRGGSYSIQTCYIPGATQEEIEVYWPFGDKSIHPHSYT